MSDSKQRVNHLNGSLCITTTHFETYTFENGEKIENTKDGHSISMFFIDDEGNPTRPFTLEYAPVWMQKLYRKIVG